MEATETRPKLVRFVVGMDLRPATKCPFYLMPDGEKTADPGEAASFDMAGGALGWMEARGYDLSLWGVLGLDAEGRIVWKNGKWSDPPATPGPSQIPPSC